MYSVLQSWPNIKHKDALLVKFGHMVQLSGHKDSVTRFWFIRLFNFGLMGWTLFLFYTFCFVSHQNFMLFLCHFLNRCLFATMNKCLPKLINPQMNKGPLKPPKKHWNALIRCRRVFFLFSKSQKKNIFTRVQLLERGPASPAQRA